MFLTRIYFNNGALKERDVRAEDEIVFVITTMGVELQQRIGPSELPFIIQYPGTMSGGLYPVLLPIHDRLGPKTLVGMLLFLN